MFFPAFRRALVLVMIPVALATAGCGAAPRSEQQHVSRAGEDRGERSPAEILAAADGGGAPSQSSIAAFDQALDRIAAHCPETKDKLAAMILKAQELLSDEGHIRTVREITANFTESMPDESLRFSECAGNLAIITQLMKSGY